MAMREEEWPARAEIAANNVHFYPRPRAELGEAPMWNAQAQTLDWVDCTGKALFRLNPADDTIASYALPHYPGSYAPCEAGGLIMAYRNGLCLLNLESGHVQNIATPDVDFAQARFNDGACDRAGRFWVGTMDKRMEQPKGALFRIDPDLSVHRMAEDVVVSNGIAFSPDDTVMYHTDSRSGLIYAYDFDLATGAISGRHVFVDFQGRAGRPDGCTVDTGGNLWIAENNAGQIVCVSPSGDFIAEVGLGTDRPTSVCFGGSGFDTLFVTTMQHMLTEEQRRDQPLAGCLLALDVGAKGLPEPVFSGGSANRGRGKGRP